MGGGGNEHTRQWGRVWIVISGRRIRDTPGISTSSKLGNRQAHASPCVRGLAKASWAQFRHNSARRRRHLSNIQLSAGSTPQFPFLSSSIAASIDFCSLHSQLNCGRELSKFRSSPWGSSSFPCTSCSRRWWDRYASRSVTTRVLAPICKFFSSNWASFCCEVSVGCLKE